MSQQSQSVYITIIACLGLLLAVAGVVFVLDLRTLNIAEPDHETADANQSGSELQVGNQRGVDGEVDDKDVASEDENVPTEPPSWLDESRDNGEPPSSVTEEEDASNATSETVKEAEPAASEEPADGSNIGRLRLVRESSGSIVGIVSFPPTETYVERANYHVFDSNGSIVATFDALYESTPYELTGQEVWIGGRFLNIASGVSLEAGVSRFGSGGFRVSARSHLPATTD